MKITIDETNAEQRFDRFLRKYFKAQPEVKLTDIFSRIRKGAIKINDRKRKQDYRIQIGDSVTWDDTIITEKKANDTQRTKQAKAKLYPLERIQSWIIYEDEHRLALNKPHDTVMHPGTGHSNDLSMHDILKSYLMQTEQVLPSETFIPSFCFRLDKDTTGVLIAAKTYPALQYLNQLIRERKTKKMYLAIVSGHFPTEITCEEPLFKGFDQKSGRAKVFVNHEKGQTAWSTMTCIEQSTHEYLGDISLVQVRIVTGRMHQIRVHLAHMGYPIIGDLMYGSPVINRLATKKVNISRQLLHSHTYGFFDRFSHKQHSLQAPVPDIFIRLFPHVGR